ncbi:MAG: hypothetical protein COV08_00995 [Candidatus Vogelbacteria bacterium CG10_big_fil_rev_8_21_14_0_10_49_38]|uniref:Uncharacterized protein n=1 Tax=Candidatus Vogelbacteria bacterium CG10_big_fil_rev_8_21_14_0_10_49_38 TaxID=1975043 RepID=A0A2H0RIC0_9BACT|nr:MAG: hypothetical protein BK006_01005 [bacterium CG10_49_38]PIR46180.1 MAG: hypothetical protein COV08_00995 [Candidatus Vogelbacteria bacterium CG10_big_fil_rev_8_21_14_0_10_49_38]
MSDKIVRLPHLKVWQRDRCWWGQLLFTDRSMSEEFNGKFLALVALLEAQERKSVVNEDILDLLDQIGKSPLSETDCLRLRRDGHDKVDVVLVKIMRNWVRDSAQNERREFELVSFKTTIMSKQAAKATFN